MYNLRNILTGGAEDMSDASSDSTKDNPWSLSSEEGILVQDGRIRLHGFGTPLTEPLGTPRVARRTPASITLKPGRYSWCTCGHSKDQPFCDNSHRAIEDGPAWRSYKFAVLEETSVTLCRCKRTNVPPFCDCQHEKLP